MRAWRCWHGVPVGFQLGPNKRACNAAHSPFLINFILAYRTNEATAVLCHHGETTLLICDCCAHCRTGALATGMGKEGRDLSHPKAGG